MIISGLDSSEPIMKPTSNKQSGVAIFVTGFPKWVNIFESQQRIKKWRYLRYGKKKVKGKAIPVTGREGPYGLWDVEVPTFSTQSAQRWRWGCQPYVPATFYSSPGRFLVLNFVTGWVIAQLEGLGKLKISNDIIGNRTHNLPVCSIVPQPATLPHAPLETWPWRKTLIHWDHQILIHHIGMALLFLLICVFCIQMWSLTVLVSACLIMM
jgi:hypothetical protein